MGTPERGAARTAALIALPVAVLAGLGVFHLLGGFDGGSANRSASQPVIRPQLTGPVPMAAPSLDDHAGMACQMLLAALPERIKDRARRPVTAGAEQNAAWGDPAITLACGVAGPTVPAEAKVWLLDGVCWYADGPTWTTVDRDVPVAVTVPAAYTPPGQWVIELSGPLTQAVSRRPEVPTGCR